MDIRAVLFDLDGTLVDTLPDIAWCLNHVLTLHGLRALQPDEVRGMIGGGVSAMLERAAVGLDAEQRQRLHDDYSSCYHDNLVQRSRAFPGCVDLIETIAGKGLPMAVVTNKAHPLAERVVQGLLPAQRFGAVLGHRPGERLKPAPDIALRAAKRLGIDPGHCLFVGDTPIDLLTAKAAGMPAAAVGWGYGVWQALLEQRPQFHCQQPLHLLRALGPEQVRHRASQSATPIGSL
ncbi:HAD-IA family hydrolase [Pseudomonas sp. B21-023]|uniref:HAD family hydrolase n=1 Tax=unclassified Pseudomonas TaxID=196821 RepID=UPI00111B9275|nr:MULTISPECIES: HAD-IA family hydrolase [unclassified Pseudomonas]UVL18501.1 HAD-IA family hydrolase [Pseudomonas sp. B21-044]UVM15913.1 HAD-IA family hydrolase [Pseudomonas sp. B21-023]